MDMKAIAADLDRSIQTSSAEVQVAMSGDLSNPEQLLKAQYAISTYAQMIQLTATFTKKVDDMISGVIAKI